MAKQVVKIERMAPEGQGLGRAVGAGAGKVVFVPYAVPGDTLETEIESAKPGYATARLERVLEAGAERVPAPCPYHFRPGRNWPWCGGCDWQQLSPKGQLEAKRAVVVDCLRRIGRLDVPVSPTLASPEAWRYRNKVQVPFGARGGAVVAGFYAPGTHQIVDLDDCPVQPEGSVRIVRALKDWARERRWQVYDEKSHRGWLRHALIRTSRDGRAQVSLVTRSPDFHDAQAYVAMMRESFPSVAGLFQNVQAEKSSVILGPKWRLLWGSPTLEERVGRLKLSASPGAFLQVNTPASEVLYENVARQVCAGELRPELVADLYCGVGAIALWIASAVRRVVGVEESREAVSDAWANARANGISNASFMAGRAETLLGRLRRELSRAAPGQAVAIVDPPRAGVSPAVLRTIAAPAVGRVVYVSCNPATFARDAAALARAGFAPREVQPVDLFPQTSHVEIAARFDRGRLVREA